MLVWQAEGQWEVNWGSGYLQWSRAIPTKGCTYLLGGWSLVNNPKAEEESPHYLHGWRSAKSLIFSFDFLYYLKLSLIAIRRNTKVGFFEWEFAPHYVIFLEQKRTHVFVPKKETGNIDDDDDTIGH